MTGGKICGEVQIGQKGITLIFIQNIIVGSAEKILC